MQGSEHGWLLGDAELVFVTFCCGAGQHVVRDYVAGLLSRIDLNMLSTIASQRDELSMHQTRPR